MSPLDPRHLIYIPYLPLHNFHGSPSLSREAKILVYSLSAAGIAYILIASIFFLVMITHTASTYRHSPQANSIRTRLILALLSFIWPITLMAMGLMWLMRKGKVCMRRISRRPANLTLGDPLPRWRLVRRRVPLGLRNGQYVEGAASDEQQTTTDPHEENLTPPQAAAVLVPASAVYRAPPPPYSPASPPSYRAGLPLE
jgi:hypothetical protein